MKRFLRLLNGLGRDYEAISVVIENSMDSLPAPTLDDVMTKVVSYEDKL